MSYLHAVSVVSLSPLVCFPAAKPPFLPWLPVATTCLLSHNVVSIYFVLSEAHQLPGTTVDRLYVFLFTRRSRASVPLASMLPASLRRVFPLLPNVHPAHLHLPAPWQVSNLRRHALNTRIHFVFPAVLLDPPTASLPQILEYAIVPIQFSIFFRLAGHGHVYEIDGLSVHLSYCIPVIVQWDVVLVIRLMNLVLILWLCFVGFGNMKKGLMTNRVEVFSGFARYLWAS